MRSIFFFAALLAFAGCTTAPNTTCDPKCAAGFHCGGNNSCVSDGILDAGVNLDAAAVCSPACGGLTPYCSATHHCVGCVSDTQCPQGSHCATHGDSASCAPGCTSDDNCHPDGGAATERCCGAFCSDTTRDPENCGGCAMACSVPHAAAGCSASQCVPGACNGGWDDCNMDPKDGCEANLHVDPANCGACGTACAIANAISGCSDGCYIQACDFGFDDCNSDEKDGCETPTATDPGNCGTCGTSCPALANASTSCVSGNCVLGLCNAGFFDCNGLAVDGCEVNIFTDGANCGQCGNACGNGLVCQNGGCTCAKCNFAHAASSCVNNACIMGACVAGYADCNGNSNDGCEVATGTDPNNCGQCGNVCPQNMKGCANGTCQNMVEVKVGNFTPFGMNSNHGANFLLGSPIQVNQTSTLARFGVISRSAGPMMTMALYNDMNGAPHTLMSQTPSTALTNSVQEIAVNPVVLPAGQYWIMAVYNVAASVGYDMLGGTVDYVPFNYGGALPNPFPAPATYGGQEFNYYLVVLQ